MHGKISLPQALIILFLVLAISFFLRVLHIPHYGVIFLGIIFEKVLAFFVALFTEFFLN
ncbi:hypothetical protein JOC76_002204 [Neobacillus cucumis]|nr:hypothetical protein [Neobacillus cucumis]